MADWPWQRKKKKKKNPARSGQLAIAYTNGPRSRAAASSLPIVEIARGRGRWRRRRRERLYAPTHTQKHKGVAGRRPATPEWNGNGHHPRPRPAAPADLIHLIPGRSNARRGLGALNSVGFVVCLRFSSVDSATNLGTWNTEQLPCFRAAVCSRSCFSGHEVTTARLRPTCHDHVF